MQEKRRFLGFVLYVLGHQAKGWQEVDLCQTTIMLMVGARRYTKELDKGATYIVFSFLHRQYTYIKVIDWAIKVIYLLH